MATVLVIPDLHCPYQHPGAFDFVRGLARTYKPDRVVCLGDEADLASMSRYAKDPDLPSPADELVLAVEALQPWYRAFPVVQVCESNHVQRLWKRAFEAGLPLRAIRSPRSIFQAPKGWRWGFEWRIDGVLYRHGDGLAGATCAKLAAERFRQPIVFGHIHSVAAIHRLQGVGGPVWAMAAGCLIDERAPAFGYARHFPARPVLGAAVVRDGAPLWFPLE